MRFEYFIASRWRNRELVRELTDKLRIKKRTVYCFLESESNISDELEDPEFAMEQFESITNWHENASVRRIFAADMHALSDSQKLILLLPAGKSAHMEAGVAYGLGRHCILIGQQEQAESLYLIFSERYSNIDSFIANLD